MPRETVEIPISEDVPFEAASQWISYIAYLDNVDNFRRARFAYALCRSGHSMRMAVDPQWGNSTQKVKPYTFIETDNGANKALCDGTKLAWRRIITAYVSSFICTCYGKAALEGREF
jgi:hypothetical protein